jgi:hypothetical protein
VAVPIGGTRGIVAARDGNGREFVVTCLADWRGGAALLMIDADTGESEEHPVPFPPDGKVPFAFLLSSKNRVYLHFNNHLVEFHIEGRAYTYVRRTAALVAVGMTEDDRGRIWGVAYPDSSVFMYDPGTGAFRDYGSVYQQNWRQYQHAIAADDAGWIYFSVGRTLSQLVALNPESGKAVPLLPEEERVPNVTANLYRGEDGRVYGLADENNEAGPWYRLYRGRAVKLGGAAPKPRLWPFHHDLPSGRRLKTVDMTRRLLDLEDPKTQQVREVPFNYPTDGAHVMEVAALPDGTIGGGVAFPMRLFRFDPAADQFEHWEVFAQANVIAVQDDLVFLGAYMNGRLLEWNPARPWVSAGERTPDANPRLLTDCEPDINRPHAILAHSDGRTIVMGGTPAYGHTGGGLLCWDRKTQTRTLLKHTELLGDHSVMSLVSLPGGRLLVGSGTRAGTGGEVRANEAELYALNLATRRIEWHAGIIPGAQEYSEMRMGPGGLVYGIADLRVYDPTLMDEQKTFFVFDPIHQRILYREDTAPVFGSMHLQQGQRKILVSPDRRVYLLFRKGIAQADPDTFKLSWLARPPVSIDAGGAWLDGRIYFASGSRLYSYCVKATSQPTM